MFCFNLINEIVNSFKDLTPLLWVSQIAGLIGLILVCISYQFDKKKYLAISVIAFSFFVIEQVFAVLVVNVVVTVAGLLRNLLIGLYLKRRQEKTVPQWQVWSLVGMMWVAVFIAMGIMTLVTDKNEFANWTNYLPLVLVSAFSVLINNKNYYLCKLGAFIQEGGFFLYYTIFRLPVSAMRQAILTISVIVSVVLMIIKDIKRNKEISVEE